MNANMNPMSRRQQQPRSNSIGGQDFHSYSGSYQRLKNSVYAHQSPYVDPNLYYSSQAAGQARTNGHHQAFAGRSISPLSLHNEHSANLDLLYQQQQQRSNNNHPQQQQFKYQHSTPLRGNQLHASLECLNTSYPDQDEQLGSSFAAQRAQKLSFHNQFPVSPQLFGHQFQQNQQIFQQNQHYAASFTQRSAAAQQGAPQFGVEQDLAAAAMGSPPQQQQQQQAKQQYSASLLARQSLVQQQQQPSSHYNGQNLINRALNHLTQSPLRSLNNGFGSSATTPTPQVSSAAGQQQNNVGASSSILNQLTPTQNPIRPGHSSLSLAASHHLFPMEEKFQTEVKKLQSDLKTEKEKNEALNSQLNINQSLMAAFEQSLTTLNTRLRQLTALNEQKDKEIEELKGRQPAQSGEQNLTLPSRSEKSTSPISELTASDDNARPMSASNEHMDKSPTLAGEPSLLKVIEDLKRQLIEKDRLLTDTRLEALSLSHQLEQLESRMNGEHSLLANERDDYDEGVMVASNHSPSDSEAITDSAHFSEITSHTSSQQVLGSHQRAGDAYGKHNKEHDDVLLLLGGGVGGHEQNSQARRGHTSGSESNCSRGNNSSNLSTSYESTSEQSHQPPAQQQQRDDQSNHSAESRSEHQDNGKCHFQDDYCENNNNNVSAKQSGKMFENCDAEAVCKLMDNMLIFN